jgi:hypothetical protein
LKEDIPMFVCCPDRRCHAPGKSFTDAGRALRWAQAATDQYEIGYVVWNLDRGQPRRFRTFYPSSNRRRRP